MIKLIFAVLTIFWLFLVHCWYTVGTVLVDIVTTVHQWSFLLFWPSFDCFDCFWLLVHCWYSRGRTVTIDTPMVFFAVLTVPTVYQSSKTGKKVKQQKMTIGVPIVTCLHRVRRIHKAHVRIAGCSHRHLAKSMSWSCRTAGCKNSIRHIENRISPFYFLFFNAVWALTSRGFRIVSDTLV